MTIFKNFIKFKTNIALIDIKNKKNFSYNYLEKINFKIFKIIKKKSITLMFSNNSSSSIMLYAGLVNSDTILILLDDKMFIKDLNSLILNFKPNYICVNSLLAKEKKLKNIFSLQDFSICKTSNKFENINEKNKLLISTSGTSQYPKFVRLSKKNIIDNSKKIINYLSIRKNQTTITTLPMAYSYGLSIINTHLMVGAKIVINNNSFFEKKFWKTLKKYNVNSFGTVPIMLSNLLKIGLNNLSKTSIKLLTLAGGKLNESKLRIVGAFCKLNDIKLMIMYGQTEASPRISYLDWKFFFKKISSIGKPLKGYKLKIINKNKSKIGEIQLSGNNVFLGYAKNYKDLFLGDLQKSILKTGDYGYKDKENFFYITGRKNNFIKFFGNRIDLSNLNKKLLYIGVSAQFIPKDQKLLVLVKKNKNLISTLKIKRLIKSVTKINSNLIDLDYRIVENINFKNQS